MKKVWYIVFIAAFFLACLVPTVGMLIAGPSDAAANEAPAAQPRLTKADGSVNTGVLDDLESYVNKGFFLRLNCITAWDTLYADLLNTSANDDVLIGPDGWLFYGAAVNDISGANQLTDRQIWCAARGLYLMQEYAAEQGAAFVFTVPCGKYTLYPEHAPDYITVAESSNRERLAEALAEQGVNYADLYEAFSQVDEELYWQWDSHWNSKGAALAADSILAAAGLDGSYFDGPFQTEYNHSGDLYAMLYPTGTALEADYVWTSGFHFTYTSDFHDYDDITIQTENTERTGSLLLFRDSSGRNLYPYLAESFGTAFISRLNNYRLDYITEQQSTLVVVELAERTLDYLVKYAAVYPAPVRDADVLTDMQAVDSELTEATGSASMDGYVQVTGTLPETAVDSPVYLVADGTVYEAIPNEGYFTAWLPENCAWEGAAVYVSE